ncbi:MAG: pyridoxine 5'-phosphate synthase [Thioalkalivibrionaceae bacterium]
MKDGVAMMSETLLLGVNLDHVATIRQARRTPYPDLMHAVRLAEASGADSITLHLREDRRHIQDDDVFAIKPRLAGPMNLEMAATEGMLKIALELRPEAACLVPEKREELTTEGGLDVRGQKARLAEVVSALRENGTRVSLFIEPDEAQIDAAVELGAPVVELHTGAYANARAGAELEWLLESVRRAAGYAREQGLVVHAGHGLDYQNVRAIAALLDISELNIGHSIVSRALFTGLPEAVSHMRSVMDAARLAAIQAQVSDGG